MKDYCGVGIDKLRCSPFGFPLAKILLILMISKEKILALIPARGGSKRVPGKNTRCLGGRPLIAYTVDLALEARRAGLIDRVILSTDEERIKDIVEGCGLEVDYMRPPELALDESGDKGVIRHVLEYCKEELCEEYDVVIYLRPTSPFRSMEDIEKVVEKMSSGEYNVCRTVTRAEGVDHPYWMYRPSGDTLKPLMDVGVAEYSRSQMLDLVYRLNGVVDGVRVDYLGRCGDFCFLDEGMAFVEVEGLRAADIDTEDDFRIAECLLEKGLV